MPAIRFLVVTALLIAPAGCRLLGQEIPCRTHADCPDSLSLCQDQVCVAGRVPDEGGVLDAAVVDATVVDATVADAMVADAMGADAADAGAQDAHLPVDATAADTGLADVSVDAAARDANPADALAQDSAAATDAGPVDTLAADLVASDATPGDIAVLDSAAQDQGPSPDVASPPDAGTGDGGSMPDSSAVDASGVIATCTDMPAVDAGVDTCTVGPGSGPDLIVYGDLLLPDGVVANGGVRIDARGTITCVGCGCLAATARSVVCPGALVSPGLIDGRTHSSWSNAAPYNPVDAVVDPALRWEHRHDWRRGEGDDPPIPSPANGTAASRVWGELRWILAGTTSANAVGNATGLVRDLSSETARPDSTLPAIRFETFPLDDTLGQVQTSGCAYQSFVTRPPGRTFTPVVAEGIGLEAHNEFLCLSGADPAHDLLTAPAALLSAIALDASDVDKMASRGLGLVWTPRSDASLYGHTAPVPLLRHLGVEVGLGSWWPVTGSRHLLHELRCARQLGQDLFAGQLDHRELWRMVTFGAAAALGVDDAIGVLRPGLRGDLAVFAPAGRVAYQAVVEATPAEVALLLVEGQVRAGRSAVVAGMGQDCTTFDACGAAYTVCLGGNGWVWSDLETAAQTNQWPPLIACEPVAYERPCLAARTLAGDAVSGTRVHSGVAAAGDQDGDGVLDGSDNCPSVFNPVRPMDMGAQANVDGDDWGDVCDPCPLTSNSQCTRRDRDDRDADFLPNWSDNCPDVANSGQVDSDSDFVGDACDACPVLDTRDGTPCPVTLYQVHENPLLLGHSVALSSLIVTAVGPRGIFVQVDPLGSDYTSDAHSGIYVYTNTAPAPVVVRGDLVDFTSARVTDFNGMLELTEAVWTSTGQSSEPAPVLISDIAAAVAQGAAHPLNGVLVEIQGVNVATVDGTYWEFTVTGGLTVGDDLYRATPFPTPGAIYPVVRGPLVWFYDKLAVWPRSQADLGG